MKRLLAILALVGVVLIVPLTALATDEPEFQEPSAPQGIPAQNQDNPPDLEQDNQGDPDELGGGFRGSGDPPDSTGAGPGFWLEPYVILVMNLV